MALSSLSGAPSEAVPALNELLREAEEPFRELWDQVSKPYGDMFRRTALTLASTGAVTLSDAANALNVDGDLSKGTQYAAQYGVALRLLASCVSTATILLPPGTRSEREPPPGVLLSGLELFQFQQLINIGQLIQDPSAGISIDLTMARLDQGQTLPAPWADE